METINVPMSTFTPKAQRIISNHAAGNGKDRTASPDTPIELDEVLNNDAVLDNASDNVSNQNAGDGAELDITDIDTGTTATVYTPEAPGTFFSKNKNYLYLAAAAAAAYFIFKK